MVSVINSKVITHHVIAIEVNKIDARETDLWSINRNHILQMACTVAVVNKSDDSSKEKGELIKIGNKKEDQGMTCYECYSLFWKAKIITVEPVVFLYMLGMSFIESFIFQYFFQRYARDQLPQSVVQYDFCITDNYLNTTAGNSALDSAENHAAYLTFLVSLTAFLMTAISTILMGPLTDRFGRRFAIASVNFGSMISSLLMMIIVYRDLDLYYFIAANLMSSMLGGFGVLFAATYAYIADISSHQTRSLRIGILELMIYISSALTRVLGGIWLSEVDCNFTSLTWAPFICFMLNLLYTLFLLPESVCKVQTQSTEENTGGNKLKTFWKGILLYFRPRLVTLKLWICLGVILIVTINATGSVTINTYFYIRQPLKWNPDQIGLYGGYSQITHGLALLLVMLLALIIGIPDVLLAITGVLCSCLGYLFIAGVTKTWEMYASELQSNCSLLLSI